LPMASCQQNLAPARAEKADAGFLPAPDNKQLTARSG
jgi:hypothetical protein